MPRSAFDDHAQSGFLAAAIYPPTEDKYRSGIKLPGGIAPADWDIFCDFIVRSFGLKLRQEGELTRLQLVDEGTRLGYLGVNWGLGGGNGIGAPPLVVFGTEEQKQRLLVPVLRGEQRCCLGITEPSGGSDVAAIKTTARRTDKGWIVNGQKKVRYSLHSLREI